jgi:hypothetical protein
MHNGIIKKPPTRIRALRREKGAGLRNDLY